MNAANHWNPGWQFVNPQRAQAGGNRALRPPPQVLENGQGRRIVPAQNQNRRNNNRPNNNNNNIRRENRREERLLSREDAERLETVARKNHQTRTALEYDTREDQCWSSIMNNLDLKARQFESPLPNVNPDIPIPDEEEICSNLRKENQYETILATREMLIDFGATEHDLSGALKNLELHLRTNACEYNAIESVSNDLIRTIGQLTTEIDELEEILRRMDKIRIQ